MKKRWSAIHGRCSTRVVLASFLVLLLAAPGFAQAGASPWENAVNVLQQAFTSTIARGLSLVAIVVAGLTYSPSVKAARSASLPAYSSALGWLSRQ